MAQWPAVEFTRVDFADREAMESRIRAFGPTALVHCAATGMEFPHTRWFELLRFNVDLTVNLCESVANIPGCHFVFVGTGLAYRPETRPLTERDALDTLHPYGASKAAADLLLRSAAAEFEVPLTVLRPFSFTGLGDDRTRLFSSLLRAAAEGRPMLLSPCRQVRDHCSARDIAGGIVRALECGHRHVHEAGIYNLGSGSTTPLRAVIEQVVTELNLEVDLQFGARPIGRFDPDFLVADITKAARELDWRPRHNLVHAVWQLACESFPSLHVREPTETA